MLAEKHVFTYTIRMVIGIDATRANKPQKTGVEWYSYHLIRELVKLPSPHTFRLYFRNTPEEGLAHLGANVEYRILRWPFRYLWTQARLSIEMLFSPPDMLFVPAAVVPPLHPARTVTTIHDVAYLPYPQSYSWFSRWYLHYAARKASRLPMILTISRFSKDEIVKYYGVPQTNIAVTHLGFAHTTVQPASMVTTKFNIEEPYLLYIGRLERKKNVAVLVKAFDLIKREPWGNQFELVLAGIKGHGWEEIEQTIAASKYRDDIKIIGWVTEEEKHTLFARATAFILLSAYEGFSIPLLEAMAARTPAITSDQAALPEVGGTAVMRTPRGDTAAVRDALHTIIFDHALRQSLIDEGSRRVKSFTWRHTAEQTLAALNALEQRPVPTK
ncbi:MAG: hypothetical protein A3B31_00765 [Candidatus Komeilibacteria bacterium RIFCSPLOWO2_01_FULL_53_11]|uniref:Glycosyl transferase family 1 domain-containing protein n=1 Tax=Candidatus Komeilibacteria bacterium RIFCSPLOWO2_01_FULL_53_11 TaxID=1798552 RepID=A0A1G2BT39_9BACT|nr:MAG: hypothetical protein A3B31_00765 [Candidatus Komeilibacteria bacterium RIFCSPLOWO2_01_FULL_53_11]